MEGVFRAPVDRGLRRVGLGHTQVLLGAADSPRGVAVCPTDVPVSLLQVQQRRRQPAPGARHDAALSAAHAPLPPVPGHAQQQDPPAAAPHPPPQRGTRLRGEAHYDGKTARSRPVGVKGDAISWTRELV